MGGSKNSTSYEVEKLWSMREGEIEDVMEGGGKEDGERGVLLVVFGGNGVNHKFWGQERVEEHGSGGEDVNGSGGAGSIWVMACRVSRLCTEGLSLLIRGRG